MSSDGKERLGDKLTDRREMSVTGGETPDSPLVYKGMGLGKYRFQRRKARKQVEKAMIRFLQRTVREEADRLRANQHRLAELAELADRVQRLVPLTKERATAPTGAKRHHQKPGTVVVYGTQQRRLGEGEFERQKSEGSIRTQDWVFMSRTENSRLRRNNTRRLTKPQGGRMIVGIDRAAIDLSVPESRREIPWLFAEARPHWSEEVRVRAEREAARAKAFQDSIANAAPVTSFPCPRCGAAFPSAGARFAHLSSCG